MDRSVTATAMMVDDDDDDEPADCVDTLAHRLTKSLRYRDIPICGCVQCVL